MKQAGFDFERIVAERTDLPNRSAKQAADRKRTSPKIYSVSDLTREIRHILEGGFRELWIAGEVSNFRSPSSGHFYFTLKDEAAQIGAVMFRGSNARLPFQLEDGLEVVCHGRLSVYETRGVYQIVVDRCEPKGMGALQLAFEQLKQKLQKEGLFESIHKKPLPFLPKCVGVVTSGTGAAVSDILNILHRRFPGVNVLVVPVKVQGEGAAREIAEGISLLNRRGGVDVMIVGRGGGSLEDLWAFNEEVVARAIFASGIPVVSAVGHEIDFTIADFVADVRAPTPSAAAELVVPNRSDLSARLLELKRQLAQAIRFDMDEKFGRCRELKEKLKDPTFRFPDLLIRVDDLRSRLQRALQVALEMRSQNMKKLLSNLNHLSPLHILAKGYSVVQKKNDHLVKSAKALKKGEEIQITFHEGKCMARVMAVS